jgi:hypothetical protein
MERNEYAICWRNVARESGGGFLESLLAGCEVRRVGRRGWRVFEGWCTWFLTLLTTF